MNCMCILKVSSGAPGLIVADFFVHASMPSAELGLEDTGANTKGERKKGGPEECGNATPPLHSRGPQQRGTKLEVAASPLPS